MALHGPVIAGGLLIAVGVHQLTPLKENCLNSLPLARRLPRHALAAARWVHGAWGSPMAYCVGCCAALMLLLFAGGVMNLVWIAGLSLLVLAEKSLPRGERLSVALGVLMLIAGTGLIASAVVD